jgi:hypothetical protein
MSFDAWLAGYFADARTPMTVDELAADFAALGGRVGGVPRAGVATWRREIVAAIARHGLTVDPAGLVRPASPTANTKPTQLDLFDL